MSKKDDEIKEVKEKDRIIEVEPETDKYRMCNICRTKINVCNISLGCEKRSISIAICDKCLVSLKERIAEFLDEYEF